MLAPRRIFSDGGAPPLCPFPVPRSLQPARLTLQGRTWACGVGSPPDPGFLPGLCSGRLCSPFPLALYEVLPDVQCLTVIQLSDPASSVPRLHISLKCTTATRKHENRFRDAPPQQKECSLHLFLLNRPGMLFTCFSNCNLMSRLICAFHGYSQFSVCEHFSCS